MWVGLRGIWFCLPMGPRVLICMLQGEGRAGTWTPGAAVPVLGFRTCHEQGVLFDLLEFQNNACGLRAPKSSSSKQAFFLSFIPLIQFPTGYLSLHIPSLCWKHMLLKFSLKISYRTHQVLAELPFFLKILAPLYSFLTVTILSTVFSLSAVVTIASYQSCLCRIPIPCIKPLQTLPEQLYINAEL